MAHCLQFVQFHRYLQPPFHTIEQGRQIQYTNKQRSLSISKPKHQKIKGVAGVSPNEFIRSYRLRQAAKMINDTNLTLSEIAYKVGFNDSLYFSKCFKKQFGVAPSKYLNSRT